MSNAVNIKLLGGLGNNLFQIASAYSYSLKNDKELVLINEKFGATHKPLSSYKDNIFNQIIFVDKYDVSKFNIYNENGFHFQEIPHIDGDVFLNGHFQSGKYFKEHSNEIKRLFQQPNLAYKNIMTIAGEKYGVNINIDNTCSIHVRRGDYLSSPNHHPAQNMNYYMKAIRQMSKDTVFLIFSDDIAWCKENFPDLPEKFKFVEGNADHEDLLLMSNCKNNIICNSTFSWWAAWLNTNSEKKVIIPDKWFGPAYADYNTEDLYCENWIRI